MSREKFLSEGGYEAGKPQACFESGINEEPDNIIPRMGEMTSSLNDEKMELELLSRALVANIMVDPRNIKFYA